MKLHIWPADCVSERVSVCVRERVSERLSGRGRTRWEIKRGNERWEWTEFSAWTKSRKCVKDWLIQLHCTLTFLSFQPGSIYFISIFLPCLLPLYPIKRCTNFSSFFSSAPLLFHYQSLSLAFFSVSFLIRSPSLCMSITPGGDWGRGRAL